MLGLVITGVRAFYLISAAIIIGVRFVPALRERFLAYGAREKAPDGDSTNHDGDDARVAKDAPITTEVLDFISTIKVPHAWFAHFYIVSVVSSLTWIHLIYSHHDLFEALTGSIEPLTSSTSVNVVDLCLLLMLLQGTRRLYECLTLSKPSLSQMWIGHYAIGLVFYILTNIAIWIDHAGSREVMSSPSLLRPISLFKLVVTLFIFGMATRAQHDYHVYLANLPKYTLPDRWMFRYIVAPHYTAECAVYLSLAILSAPASHLLNRTMLCTFMFVLVNLGITADGTKTWMLGQFPQRKTDIQRRWRMIPLLW